MLRAESHSATFLSQRLSQEKAIGGIQLWLVVCQQLLDCCCAVFLLTGVQIHNWLLLRCWHVNNREVGWLVEFGCCLGHYAINTFRSSCFDFLNWGCVMGMETGIVDWCVNDTLCSRRQFAAKWSWVCLGALLTADLFILVLARRCLAPLPLQFWQAPLDIPKNASWRCNYPSCQVPKEPESKEPEQWFQNKQLAASTWYIAASYWRDGRWLSVPLSLLVVPVWCGGEEISLRPLSPWCSIALLFVVLLQRGRQLSLFPFSWQPLQHFFALFDLLFV